MLKVYMDESCTHEDAPIVTIAAAISNETNWKNWTNDWNEAESPIDVVHAVDANRRAGEFKGWSKNERTALCKQFLSVVPKHNIELKVSGIDSHTFTSGFSHRPDILTWFRHPYYACLQWMMEKICKQAKADGQEHVEFIYEENQYRTIAKEKHEYVKRAIADPIGIETSFVFGPKKDVVPLQCAEFVAYEAHKQLQVSNIPSMRKAIPTFDPNGSMTFTGYLHEDMPELVEQVTRHYDSLRRNHKNN